MARERIAIVLGAAVRADGSPSATLALRVDHACALLARSRVDRICLTGGIGRHPPAEAEAARRHAIARGASPDRLILETISTSTLGNLVEALAILPPEADLVLVSSRWHLPRAWAMTRVLGRTARTSGPRGTAPPLWTLRAALREGFAMPASLLRAWHLRAVRSRQPTGARRNPR